MILADMELLDKENTALLIIDVQEKLMEVMVNEHRILTNIRNLLQLSKLYNLPVIITEHFPKWLGATLPQIITALASADPIKKLNFNCCDVDDFNRKLDSTGRKNIIITGVESHICVFQTCISILEQGFNAHVPQDAVDSRTEENWRVGLELMNKAGAYITSTETVIYQILKRAGTKEFKKMLKLIR